MSSSNDLPGSLSATLAKLAPKTLAPPYATVAWSGGADSTALLSAYLTLLGRAGHGGEVTCVHVDHGLRPDSGDDASFCHETIRKLGVVHGNELRLVLKVVRLGLGSATEAAARQARYAALGDMAKLRGCGTILTAHHADDNLETLLLALVRGAGLVGLAGVRPLVGLAGITGRPEDQGMLVCRPLLSTTRTELVSTLHKRGIPWREDPTNTLLDRRRNRMRHEVLPLLRSIADSPSPMLRTARVLHCDRLLLERLAGLALDSAVVPCPPGGQPADLCMDRTALRKMDPSLLLHVLRAATISQGARTDFECLSILATVIQEEPRGTIHRDIPGLRVTVDPSTVRLIPGGPRERSVPSPQALSVPGHLDWHGTPIYAHMLDAPLPTQGSPCLERFEADKVALPLVVRPPRRGERIQCFGGRRRLLSRILIDSKIPQARRSLVAVVDDAEGRCLWVVGVVRSAHAPITDSTSMVLELQCWGAPAGG